MDVKEKIGEWAAAQVRNGMTVGLGTGSTAAFFVQHLARRVHNEKLKLTLASSSVSTETLAQELGLTITPMEQLEQLDLYADGADEFDPQKRLLKGRGAAMLREKVLAHAAKKFLVIVDASKRVPQLCTHFAIPVEIFPLARGVVGRELKILGAETGLRMTNGKALITDQGNHVLDARFQTQTDFDALEIKLDAIPGVAGHGLFTRFSKRITIGIATTQGIEVLE